MFSRLSSDRFLFINTITVSSISWSVLLHAFVLLLVVPHSHDIPEKVEAL